MLKTGLSAVLLLAASAAAAQPAQTPPPAPTPPSANTPPPQAVQPPPGFLQAAEAMGQCVDGAIGRIPATVTPEATAAQAIAGCNTQLAALQTQFDAWIDSAAFPAAGREMARQQFRAQIGQAEAQLAESIRQRRANPSPTPAN